MSIQIVELSGTPYQRGKQYGIAVRDEINKYLNDGFLRVNRIRTQALSISAMNECLETYLDVLKDKVPDLLLELEGLADGAGITRLQALAFQYRRELIGINAQPDSQKVVGDCTTFAVNADNSHLLGQTVDQDGLISEFATVLKIKSADPAAPEILMFSFVGMLGYLGINSFGVGVCINLLTTNVVAKGVSPYLLVREMLNCRSAEEAVARIRKLPKATARAFTIVDKFGITCCEFTTDSFYSWQPEGDFFRANHFLHSALIPDDRLNIFSRNGSLKRQELMAQGIRKEGTSVDACFSVFSDHSLFPVGLCAHAQGDYRRPDTVAAVMLNPSEGTLWVCKGHPCESQPVRFQIGC
ncbi:C45 family autoproteolytic acyltransferase/hydolase [Thalassolituus maritimus]|nr:C45 family peptidase [Thalassolituus maritimus]